MKRSSNDRNTTYSGGLGHVVGDQLKAASDPGVPVVGVGLLYQQGYFRRITRHPTDAVYAAQIVLGPLLVKGKQRGGFEGEHGRGGHEGITQRDFGIALSVIRNVTKDVLDRTQQGIGTEMFSHFGNHHAHSNP